MSANRCETSGKVTPVMQMVILSDPLLVDSIVGRSNELEKSTSVFYDQFNVVCKHDSFSMVTHTCNEARGGQDALATAIYTLRFRQVCLSLQLAHEQEKSNLFTSNTDDWWRLIRKGLSPAFSANNLRCACMLNAICCLHQSLPQHHTNLRVQHHSMRFHALTGTVQIDVRKARRAALPLKKARMP